MSRYSEVDAGSCQRGIIGDFAKPRILHLSQSDSEGGAGKAAYRLHEALLTLGEKSIFHPGRAMRGHQELKAARLPVIPLAGTSAVAFVNALALRAYPARKSAELFSPSLFSYGSPNVKLLADADVVCLHWIAGAFLRPAQIKKLRKPIVWRLSDLWPVTGGCHYPRSCRGFEVACGACPILGSARNRDLSRLGYKQREQAYRRIELTAVAPSRWIADEARRSSLFRNRQIIHIPTGIEIDTFKPSDKAAARARFGLPQDGTVLLFGALGGLGDPRKGFLDCVRTVQAWAATHHTKSAVIVVFGGGGQPPTELAGLKVHDVGRIDDRHALAALYNAADVLLAPFAEDNLPNVVLEAIACGTPVVAYGAGGIPDAVVEGRSGALARAGDIRALVAALDRALAQRETLATGARSLAEELFDLRDCASAYADLFRRLAQCHRG